MPLFDDIVDALDSPQDLVVLKASLDGLQRLLLTIFETIKIALVTETLQATSLEVGSRNLGPPSLSDIGQKLQNAISSLCSGL